MAPTRRRPTSSRTTTRGTCVVYTGTHDNDTTVGWWTGGVGHSTRSDTDRENEREYARRYLDLDGREVHWQFIRAVLASVADTAIVPVQDLLGLGSEARMNQPGTATGNWRWRLVPGQLTRDIAQRLAVMTETYDRTGAPGRGRPVSISLFSRHLDRWTSGGAVCVLPVAWSQM